MRLSAFRMMGLVALVSWAGFTARSQDTTRVDGVRAAVLGSVTVGTVVAVHIYQQHAWWQGPRAAFRFENDWVYALNIDKLGHAYGAYLLSGLFTGALSWTGFSDRASGFWGPLMGLGYQLYVEIEDGYHQVYGFSPGDAFSDILGAAFPIAQQTYPVLRNFRMKWSYYPSQEYLNALKSDKGRVFIDDYQGQIYWLGVDPHFFLPESWRSPVPSWLGLAVGAAARNLDEQGGGTRIIYLSLDYNLSRIDTQSEVLRTLFTLLDHIHFPAPALSLEDGKIRAGLVY